jgi:NADH-quinone oxidoreductase subunit C
VAEENKQFLTCYIPASQFHHFLENLKNSADTAFDNLFCLTAADMGKEFIVVYHLNSTQHQHELVLKIKLSDRENPVVGTVCDLYRSAEFYEREVYDMFGIRFNNHPDMRRIFLDESWQGYPLRKDYTDEINIIEL